MLQDLLKAFTGSAATTAFTNPAGFGINNVPPQATFQNFFNSFSGSLNSTPQATFGGLPQGLGNGVSPGAIQAYRNIQGQFPGIPAGYSNPFEGNHKRLIKAQALAPGAVEIDNLMQPPVQQAPNLMPGVAAQLASLGSPLQGATFQNNPALGGASQGGFGVPQGGFGASFGQGQFPVSPATFSQGGIGKIQFLLAPIIGLFSLVKSLFGFRRFASSLQPVKVDKNSFSFYNYQGSYNDYEPQEGSFDDYNLEVYSQNLEAGKLEAYKQKWKTLLQQSQIINRHMI